MTHIDSLPVRRHPITVSVDGVIATAAQNYEPPAHLNAGEIAGFPWGQRTIHVKPAGEQFMVYDRAARNVLSCASTPELAAEQAVKRLRREALPPEHYSPVLGGCKFGHCAKSDSALLLHQVLDESGEILGESDLGREAACQIAVTMRLAERGRSLGSFEEFEQISVPVAVAGGTGKGTYGAVFAMGEAGRQQLRTLMSAIWKVDPEARAQEPDLKKFITAREVQFLRSAGQSKADVCEVSLAFCEGRRAVKVLLHDPSLSPSSVLRMAYRDYLKEPEAPAARHAYEVN